jgi:TatD DNase family protein
MGMGSEAVRPRLSPCLVGLCDAHCHLSSERLLRPPEETVAEALARGVSDLVMAGVDPSCWASQVRLARVHPGAHPVYGIHPWVAAELDPAERSAMLAELERWVVSEVPPVAIGETGLDLSHLAPPDTLAAQEASLREHLALARRHDLPIVFHVLRAHDPMLKLLKTTPLPERRGFVHSFSGGPEIAREYLRLGFSISFCGTISHPHSRRLRSAACEVPLDRLLVETDTPDQTPTPYRGETNRPALLPVVVAALAAARGEAAELVGERTAENARRLLGF